jgi:plasmid stability protein
MAQILVRNLDESVVRKLKKRAKKNGRSLQAEAKVILQKEAVQPKLSMEEARKAADAFRARFKGRKFTDSAELIREDRDSR